MGLIEIAGVERDVGNIIRLHFYDHAQRLLKADDAAILLDGYPV